MNSTAASSPPADAEPLSATEAAALVCWVVSDGKPGMENQCLGLAEAMGMVPVVKRIKLRSPWRQLSPWLQLGLRHAFADGSDAIVPPWPDVMIATGRHSVPAPLLVKRSSGGRTLTIQIQDCALPPRCFDLVIVPRHDRLRGANVLVTGGAMHRVTSAKLTAAAAEFAPLAATLPRPLVAVLLGGNNGVYRFDTGTAQRLAADLCEFQRRLGAGLLITPSRRTPPEVIEVLRSALAGAATVMWDGTGANPYYGFLGLADQVVATCDSVGMISEACSTGKPVYVVTLPGGSAKFGRFLDGLDRDGLTRPFGPEAVANFDEPWTVPPLDDMPRATATALAALRRHAETVGFPSFSAATSIAASLSTPSSG